MIHTTPITSSHQSPHSCPLRVLRDSIRTQCDGDAFVMCPITSDFPLFFSQQQHSPFSSSGLMSFPPPPSSIGMGSFDDLESAINEMFSSTLQIFDEATTMSANRQFAEMRAMKAFDAKLPSFVDEIVSSASASSSSSSSGDEREMDNFPPQEEVFSSLLGDLMDITRHVQMDSQRRRLSEGAIDPHLEMKDRLARRLTEYVSKTEVFQLPGGGVLRVVSINPVEETPRLGFMLKEIDECIYSRYKNGDLSSGCSMAVSSLMDFVDARRSGLQQNLFATPLQNSIPATATKESHAAPANEGSSLQTMLRTHQQYINGDDNTIRYLLYGSILSSIIVVVSLCVLAAKNMWSFAAGVALIVAAVFFGPVYMLSVLAVMIIIDSFYPSDDDEEEEEKGEGEADDFNYVNMEEDKEGNDAANADVQMNKSEQQRVFIGVPVQVV